MLICHIHLLANSTHWLVSSPINSDTIYWTYDRNNFSSSNLFAHDLILFDLAHCQFDRNNDWFLWQSCAQSNLSEIVVEIIVQFFSDCCCISNKVEQLPHIDRSSITSCSALFDKSKWTHQSTWRQKMAMTPVDKKKG
jgi:hypothetical protein